MRRHWVIGIVATLMFSVACGGESDPAASETAARELRAAVEKTAAAPSFRMEISGTSLERPVRVTIDYYGPDRQREVTEEPEREEKITIGDTTYSPDPERPGFYMFSKSRVPISGPAPFAELLAAEDVRAVGEEYLVRLGGPNRSATIRIEDGYMVRMNVKDGSGESGFELVYEYSAFGSAPEVTAPPPERISRDVTAPECPPEGGPPPDGICVSGGAPPGP